MRTRFQVSRLVGGTVFVFVVISFWIMEHRATGLPNSNVAEFVLTAFLGGLFVGVLAAVGSYLGFLSNKQTQMTYGLGFRITLIYLGVLVLVSLVPFTMTLRTDDGAAIARGLIAYSLAGILIPYVISFFVVRYARPRVEGGA
jgi:hypothetical protein